MSNTRHSRAVPLAGELAVAWALWWAGGPVLNELTEELTNGQGPRGGWTLDRLLVDAAFCLAAVLMVGGAVLLAVTATAAYLSTLRPDCGMLASLAGPVWWRAFLLGVLGVSLSAPAWSAAASASGAARLGAHAVAPRCGTACPGALTGLRLPELPTSPASTPSRATHHVTVMPGDSLWRIATRLPGQADTSWTAAYVAALHAANRAVVGPDPDVILPGTNLVLPPQKAPFPHLLPSHPNSPLTLSGGAHVHCS